MMRTKGKLAGYRRIVVTIPVFLACYTFVAMLGSGLSSRAEFFPVFSWSLFTYVSDTRVLCELDVISVDGEELPAPTQFYDLPEYFPAALSRDIRLLKTLQRACVARIEGNEAEFDALRRVIENSFLSARRNVRYKLLTRTYNPIDRWRDGTVMSTKLLGEFQTGALTR
ncbi:hypothetical protein [Nitratireductor sp. XY-223]|uniref:hypothetical protein n=1 Tax=Nitratireductor sp. XY-223 TaxID=2561926 RepID=UPI0010A9BBD9|nr:hypothetical protein [Nitratireductor sp. XY-223]